MNLKRTLIRVGISVLATSLLGGIVPSALADPSDPPLEIVEPAFTIDTADPEGVTTTASLEKGATYLVTVAGEYLYQVPNAGDLADAECSTHDINTPTPFGDVPSGQPGWESHRYDVFDGDWTTRDPSLLVNHELMNSDPLDDPLDVYVDDRAQHWIPLSPLPVNFDEYDFFDLRKYHGPGCSSDHTYATLFTPTTTGPVNVRLFDVFYEDNVGELQVEITRLTPSPWTAEPDTNHHDTVLVHSFDADGTATKAPLEEGVSYLLVARGTFHYDVDAWNQGLVADAACSGAHQLSFDGNLFPSSSGDPFWAPDRLGPNELELLVGGQGDAWSPVLPASANEGCDRALHTYTSTWTGPGDLPDGRLSLGIQDSTDPSDNRGALTVEVLELPVAVGGGDSGDSRYVEIDGSENSVLSQEVHHYLDGWLSVEEDTGDGTPGLCGAGDGSRADENGSCGQQGAEDFITYF